MPTQIKEAMVLWYDIARQGCTNENMAKNPVLRDLSGNGHDATCYNFAWSGMSGIGGYADSYIKPRWIIENKRVTATKTEAKINVTGILSTVVSIYYQSNKDEQAHLIPSYKIKVIGLTDGQSITYRDSDNTVTFQISNDGEYTLPEINFAAEGKYYGFVFNKLQDSCNITIEQLPLYPHALVSDGVDDYCLVEGLPLLNKEDGYTVIAKRKWLEHSLGSGFVSKRTETAKATGAFVFEVNTITGTQYVKSFDTDLFTAIETNDVSYLTSTSYNGNQVNKGNAEDTDRLVIFSANAVNISYFSKVALYSLLLFNRDLTLEEIKWVKRNLM